MKKRIVYFSLLGMLCLSMPIVVNRSVVQSATPDSTVQIIDSELTTTLPSQKMVLIVRKDSYLEAKVADIVRDSLVRRGYTVKTISPAFLKYENPGYYSSSIVFNGIKAADLTGTAKKYARSLSSTPSNILFFTVYGETWNNKTARTDGISAATRTINPAMIAEKILCSFSEKCNYR